MTLCHLDDIGQYGKSFGRNTVVTSSHPDDIRPGANSFGWLRVQMMLCHPDDIGQYRKSSGWHTAVSLSHPDDIKPGVNSSGWLRVQMMLCHSNDIGQYRKSSGWHTAVSLGHPDEILPIAKSSGWLCVQVSLCHPDDLLHNGSVDSRICYHESLTPWLSALLALCEGNPLVMLCIDIFRVKLNKLLNKQSKCRWVQTPWSLSDVNAIT